MVSGRSVESCTAKYEFTFVSRQMVTGDYSEHFDMLPFIGLLVCILGVLLFVTLSVAAIALGPNVTEGWLPIDAQVRNKIPVLVEWDGKTAVIHAENQMKLTRSFLDSNDKSTPELSTFLAVLQRSPAI